MNRDRHATLEEAKLLSNSSLLRDIVTLLKERAVADMLRGPRDGQPITDAWLRQKRDFANAMDAIMPAIEGMIHEIQAEAQQDKVTDAA